MSRQESPTQSTGAHRKHRAPGGRTRTEREAVEPTAKSGKPGKPGKSGVPETPGKSAGTGGAGADRDGVRDPEAVRDGAQHGVGTSAPGQERAARDEQSNHGRSRARDQERDRERDRDRDHRSSRGGRDRRPHGTLPMQPPAHYEPYLDGLFTYCLSILCDHDAASAALGEVLALAERQRAKLRDPGLRRPWLYALARWACLRRLAAGASAAPLASDEAAERRRAQLAALAWPEAAGTTPEQREALELAVRHQLSPREVAHVLGLEADAARQLLARAACEVERTRTALAVVDTRRCAAVAQLAGETRVLLGTALRTELVRHVDDCEVCRRTAERVVAAGPWPGATGAVTGAAAVLALVEASRPAAYAALLHAMSAGFGRARDATPRFDRRGFPLDLKDRAARRAQLRHRAVTSTVVAAVVAAPVLALWAAYRAAPVGEGAPGTDRATASEPDGLDGIPYEKAGSSRSSVRADPSGSPSGATPSASGPATATTVAVSSSAAAPPADGSGYLSVTARPGDGNTLVTLTAGGHTPIRWAASTAAYWLQLSARAGTLQPGESVTVVITVDRSLEPAGSWYAEIALTPGHATVTLRGSAPRSGPPPVSSSPTPSDSSSPPPSTPTTPPPTTTPPPDTSSPPPTESPSPTDSPTSADPSPSTSG